MPLTCGDGPEYDGDPDSWFTMGFNDVVLDTKRMRRCASCKGRIEVGDDCTEFPRYRCAKNDIEERIYGDEVPKSKWYHCEECQGLYEALSEIGYAVLLGEDMHDLVGQHARITKAGYGGCEEGEIEDPECFVEPGCVVGFTKKAGDSRQKLFEGFVLSKPDVNSSRVYCADGVIVMADYRLTRLR